MGALLARQCWQGWLKRGELDSFLLPSLHFLAALSSSCIGIGALVWHGVRVTHLYKVMR